MDIVVVGKLAGSYGIKGWLHLRSYTSPPENLLSYDRWHLQMPGAAAWQPITDMQCRAHKKGFIVKLAGVDEPEQALTLRGALLGVPAEVLAPLQDPDEFYWRDLLGCEVRDTAGRSLGVVQQLLETGANDVLCVQPAGGGSQVLIPFAEPYVLKVMHEEQQILVDWQPDW